MRHTINVDIAIGDGVIYHGDEGEETCRIEKLWPQMGGADTLPGVNLSNGRTSVPHRSQVPEASCYYWTVGAGEW